MGLTKGEKAKKSTEVHPPQLAKELSTAMSSPFHGMILPSYDQEIFAFAVFNSISYELTHGI